MSRKHSGHYFMTIRFPGKAVIYLIILCSFLSVKAQSQSFFYLENEFSIKGKPALTYSTFLVIESDGSVVARIRYTDPATADNRLLELKFVDSPDSGLQADGNRRYLLSYGNPVLISKTGDSGFLVPRFIFKKQEDSLGSFYVPATMEIETDKGIWIPTVTVRNEEKTYKEVKRFKDTLQFFYNEEEPLYKYFVESKERGPAAIRTEKMFLIVVANSLDSSIGVTSKKDFDKIIKTYTRIAKDLGIKTIIPQYIEGNDFSKKAVQDALKNIKPSPIDIVIFYYSGHGFRYTDDNSKYPRMSFRTKKNPGRIDNNLSVEKVYDELLSKKAKVTIVMSDCCNEEVGATPAVGREPLKPRGEIFGSLNVENAERLFFPLNQSSIIIGTADVKQLATGNPKLGGFYTHYFLAELTQSLYGFDGENPGWSGIISAAGKKATWQALSAICEKSPNSRCQQSAIFSVVPPL